MWPVFQLSGAGAHKDSRSCCFYFRFRNSSGSLQPRPFPRSVARIWVVLSKDGRRATNGAKATVATGAAGTGAVVTTAQEVTCGNAVAGKDGPVEPQ